MGNKIWRDLEISSSLDHLEAKKKEPLLLEEAVNRITSPAETREYPCRCAEDFGSDHQNVFDIMRQEDYNRY